MRRFGTNDNDFYHMAMCYENVNTRKRVVVENKSGPSFGDIEMIKIYKQRMNAGADLIFMGKDVVVDSDDGNGGTVLTAKESGKMIHVATTKSNAQVKVVGVDGKIEDEFTTTLPPKYNNERSELIIIQVEQI